MPGSPASPSRSKSPVSHSNTKTRRSTVSAAFNTGGSSATAATITNSAVVYGSSAVKDRASTSSFKDRSTSKRPAGSPSGSGSTSGAVAASGAVPSASQKPNSIVTMGTVTDPDATAAELLATKSPQLTAGSTDVVTRGGPASGVGVSSTNKFSSFVNAAGNSAPVDAGGASQGGKGISGPKESMMGSSMVSGAASSMVSSVQPVGHGIVDVTNRTGAKIEMVFSIIGTVIFASLWIYMLGFALCYRDDTWIFLTKAFSAFGVVACLFVLFHSCFEKRFTMGRGVFGCIIFFIIAVVVFLNLVDAFMAMNCICRCSTGTNAFSVGQSEDLTIFSLSLAGSFALIAVLLVSSVAHEEAAAHHHHHHHSNRPPSGV